MKWGRTILALAVILGCAGCDDNPYDVPPMAAGGVRLTARLSDPLGNVVDTLSSTSDNGVKVWLLEADARVDSNLTRNGVYVFSLKVGHTYRVLAGVPPVLTDTLKSFTVIDDARAIYPDDTLSLQPFGVLGSGPNPFSFQVELRFSVATQGTCTLEIHDLRGARVRTIANRSFPAGLHSLLWNGRDDLNGALPAGKYWALLTTPDGTSADLLILQQ